VTPGKQSANVLPCLFEACSVSLGLRNYVRERISTLLSSFGVLNEDEAMMKASRENVLRRPGSL
jgi:hypothetical protein